MDSAMPRKCIIMGNEDNVAVSLADLTKGEMVRLENGREIALKEDIRFGHKFAVCQIGKDQNIIKYGQIIGKALADIDVGELVHVNNVVSLRGGRKIEKL